MEQIERSVEELTAADSGALIVLAGDLNQLSVDSVAERTGLTPLVKTPTRGDNILDMIFVSEVCYPSVKVVTSAVKTDHKAILAIADRIQSQIEIRTQLRLSLGSAALRNTLHCSAVCPVSTKIPSLLSLTLSQHGTNSTVKQRRG